MRRLNARAHQAGVRAQGGSELGIDHHAKGTIDIDDVRVDSRHTRYVFCFRLLYVFSCGCLEVTPQGFKNFFFYILFILIIKGIIQLLFSSFVSGTALLADTQH